VSILLIEQNARAALRLSDRVYVFEGGSVQLEGNAADIAADNRIIEAYLGMSTAGASDTPARQIGGAR